MKPPSTDWSEKVGPDEAERHRKQAETLGEIQNDRTARYGMPGRGFHRKPQAALTASLEVLPDLPDHARYGLFAASGTHETWVRLSNGTFDIRPDNLPDIRGFAIKVFGVDGPDARDGSPAESQDFLFIQVDPFGLTSAEFVGFSVAMAAGNGPAAKLPFAGFTIDIFNATVPIACGPYAVRARLLPPEGQQPDPEAAQDWGADFRRRLAEGPLTYRMQLQFFVDEAITPIEDAKVLWPESEAPWVTVAHLTIPVEQPEDTEKFAAEIEAAAFAPWNALADHRPLGEVNRARRIAMDWSVRNRSGQ